MSISRQKELEMKFANLRAKLLSFIKDNSERLAKEDFETQYNLLKILNEILNNLGNSHLPNRGERYAVLSRIVIELPQHVLNPEIGGEMIKLEKQYLEL